MTVSDRDDKRNSANNGMKKRRSSRNLDSGGSSLSSATQTTGFPWRFWSSGDLPEQRRHPNVTTTTTDEMSRSSRRKAWFSGSVFAGGMTKGVNPNQQLAMYLHWMFRVNFAFLFVVMCIMFFVFVIFFAFLIMLAGAMDEECVRVGGEAYGIMGDEFSNAFGLSWTTFSTVGYGSTYPALGAENSNRTNCFFITFICSLESLIGVLYSGFCGAILFGKVLRIQSHAQVLFSDPVVIRYGPGLNEKDDDEDSSDAEDSQEDKFPCPVLEFRIINRLFEEAGGEIMDAALNVVANVDANDADPMTSDERSSRRNPMLNSMLSIAESHESVRNNNRINPISYSNRKKNSLFGPSGPPSEDGKPAAATEKEKKKEKKDKAATKTPDGGTFFSKLMAPLRRLMGREDVLKVDGTEPVSASSLGKRIFTKLPIAPCDHPFFKRVWLARHVLDEHSPILKPRVRRQIRRNGGSWPEKLNSWHALRNSLQFNQILVSMNGVSNISASDVYAQKIYDVIDVNVGYQFVNILYKDSEGLLKVDTELINDIREQKGGGGEPLIIDG